MKEVIVNPERCVGCMQCMAACAVAHSKTKQLYTAITEKPRLNARIHVGVGRLMEGFHNRCRHCDPAPCISACLAGAIYRDTAGATVFINADRCINCASCAMACPYGVIRFQEDPLAPPGQVVAVKCDNCRERVKTGQVPACVEACKSGALAFEEMGAAMAGPGLKEVCGALGIPPVLHMGSCVDNVRILVLASALADALGVDTSDLPIAGAAPEWYSEKAATIGCYFVASGVYTVLGLMPPITGSMNIVKLLTQGLNDVVGASFAVEPDPEKAATMIRRHIEVKREKLGLDALQV